MNPQSANRWLWFSGIVLCVAAGIILALALHGCSSSPPAPAAAPSDESQRCLDEGAWAMLSAPSCREALRAVSEVVRRSPQCSAALTPTGATLTSITIGLVTMICDELEAADGG